MGSTLPRALLVVTLLLATFLAGRAAGLRRPAGATQAELAATVDAAVQAQWAKWTNSLPAVRDQRVAAALGVQPNDIATDRAGAALSAYKHVDQVRAVLSDHQVSAKELAAIAQAAANATAGLKAVGWPKLQGLAAFVGDITTRVARGQLPQVEGSLQALEQGLLPRPGR
jgi:uncharacterized membrane protein